MAVTPFNSCLMLKATSQCLAGWRGLGSNSTLPLFWTYRQLSNFFFFLLQDLTVVNQASREFVINTPSTLAQKYWITNGAVHAKHIVVFAQVRLLYFFLFSLVERKLFFS